MSCCEHWRVLKRGLIGLGKVALGIGLDEPDTIRHRRDLCRECPEAMRREDWADRPSRGLTTLSRCKLCRCIIAAKTQVAAEKCPAGKW